MQVLPGSAATIRSITAEEEEVATRQKVDKEIEALVQLALAQGWDVGPHGTGLRWLHPDGERMVHTPLRVIGRGHLNVRTELAKKGLDISSLEQTKKGKTPDLSMKGLEVFAEQAELPKVSEAAVKIRQVFEEDGLVDFDESLANYLNDCTTALRRFTRDQRMAQCDHKGVEEAISRVESESLEILAENEKLQTRIETLEQRVSALGTELNEERRKGADTLDRANKAEQKLRMLRQALSLDD